MSDPLTPEEVILAMRDPATRGLRIALGLEPMPPLVVKDWPIPDPLPRDPREPKENHDA